jgi:hypothetical protein
LYLLSEHFAYLPLISVNWKTGNPPTGKLMFNSYWLTDWSAARSARSFTP